MRIVHLIQYFQPTLGYQETHLARQQIRRGHEVTVLTSDRYYPFPDYDGSIRPLLGARIVGVGRTEEEGVPVLRLPIRYENEPHRRCWMKGVGRALRELAPDVVHAHGVAEFTSIQAALNQRRVGYRLLIDGHDMWVTVQTGIVARAFYASFRALVTPLLESRSIAIVGVTDQSADIIRSEMGVRKMPVHVIELGVDTDRFTRSESDRTRVRDSLGIAPEDFVIVYTGKLVSAKDPRLILAALAKCPAAIKALFVGSGPEEYVEGMRRTIDEFDLDDRVHFQPACPQEDLPPFYSAADAACWPKQASMAMLEAASCSLPIIVVRGGLEARIANRNGLEYDEGDINGLAARFLQLYNDLDESRAMGRRGRELVERDMSWNKINLEFERLYENA